MTAAGDAAGRMSGDPVPGDTEAAPEENPQSLSKLSGWQGRRGALRGVVVVSITIVVLAVLLRQTDPRAVAAVAGQLPASVWIAALAIAMVFPLLSTTRWWLMMHAAGGAQPWSRLLGAFLGICPVNLISPSKSGDLLRALALNGRVSGSRVYACLIVERGFDLAVLGLFVLAGGVFLQNLLIVGLSFLVILAVAAVLLIAALSGNLLPARFSLSAYLEKFSQATKHTLGRPDLLAAAFAVTVAHWSLVGLLITLILAGSGSEITFIETMTAMPAAVMIGMLPVTIAGVGTREGAMLWLFSGYASPSQILAAGLLYTVLVYCLPALAGLPFTRSVLRF